MNNMEVTKLGNAENRIIETDTLGDLWIIISLDTYGFDIRVRFDKYKSRCEKLRQIIREAYPEPGVNGELELCTKMKKEELVTTEVSINVNEDGITTTIPIEEVETQETSMLSMREVGVTSTNNNVIVNQENAVLPQNIGAVVKESVDVACKYNTSISIQVQGSQGICGCEIYVIRMDTGT
jgi:hypothetical protein